MTRSREKLPPEVRALLDAEREIPAQPAAVRARAIARARAAVEAGVAAPPVHPRSSRAVLVLRWAVAAGVVCAASAAVAYGVRGHFPVQKAPAPARLAPVAIPPKAPAAAAIPAAIDDAPPSRPHVLPPPRLSPA